MLITESTQLSPDRYGRADASPVLEVATDHVTLDLAGSVIDGVDFSGIGIHVHDCVDVTVRNGVITRFYQGIRADRVRRLRIENCVVSGNHNPRHLGWLPDTVDPVEHGLGGGVHLWRSSDSVIDGCMVNDNFNGIDLVRCHRVTVRDTDASYSSNVGVHLLGSNHCTVESGRAEHCIRYTDRFWNDTADSAGILLEEFSNHNRIVENSLRYSGDGLLIRANNRHSSDHNYIARNDASFSPNNAFEAVFSEGNVFERNVADLSNFGFWLGYSHNTVVRGNEVRSNRMDGIAIEHGSGNTIEGNHISANRNGIRLWWAPSDLGDDPSSGYTIRDNDIVRSREYGISLTDTTEVKMESNDMRNNGSDLERRWVHAERPH